MDLVTITLWLSLAATTTDTIYIPIPVEGEFKIETICVAPNTTVATDGTNYRTTTVKVGSTTVTTQTTNSSGGSARTAGTPQTLTLSNTHLTITGKSDVITIESAHTGGSGAVEDLVIAIGLRAQRVV